MVDETFKMRPYQIEDLSFMIANKKCLLLHDPGCGKTIPVCVYAYYVPERLGKSTVWTMPKSLLQKNKREMHRFTEFKNNEVVILNTDRANLTKNWTGATIESTRRVATWRLKDGRMTHELALADGQKLCYVDQEKACFVALRTGKPLPEGSSKDEWFPVEPVLGPDGKTPVKEFVDVPETFKDLIADAVEKGAKVFIGTFSFLAAHWERLLKAAPNIDLLLVDELHMGYGGPESAQTKSFYWVNRHVSRFVGMTGTLINGRLDSAYPAISVIEPRYYGSLQGFMYEHAAVVDDYGRVVVWKNEAKLRQIIEKHSRRLSFQDIYGEEDVVFFTETVEMDDKVQELYDQFVEQAMLELEDGRVLDGSMPGVNAIRCRQIKSHPETMVAGLPEWTPKDERTRIHLTGQKTLLFASLKPEQERLLRLAKSLGLRAALINSDVSGPERGRIDVAAQRGELDVIVASGPTVAVGFNWEMFDLVAFISIDYQDVNILQAYRRASRGTRTKTLRVLFLRYESRVEARMYDIVKAKSQLANRVDPTRPVLDFAS